MMKLTIEGSPQELANVFKHLADVGVLPSPSENDEASETFVASEESIPRRNDDKAISVETAKHYFKRRPISKEQKMVFEVLYGANGGTVSTTNLRNALSYDSAQMRGLLGSLGKRLNRHCQGYVKGQIVLEKKWNGSEGQNYYKLPDTVRQAMDELDMF